MLIRLAQRRMVAGRTLRVACLVGFGAALAACSATEEMAPKFSEAEYGKSSPRVVTGKKKVPDGGGRYMVGQPYRVAGKTYIPQDDPEGYSATGTASWYGANFHGRKTANGEVYDMGDLTAAHPTLPLPSYVRVTNTGNGRSVIVRVNDRGPFSSNRVIDVSSETASMLDFKRAGTAKVQVEYIGPAQLDGKDNRMLVASYRAPGEGPASLNTMVASNDSKPGRKPLIAFGAKSRPAVDFSVADETMAFEAPTEATPPLDPLAPLILDAGFASSYAEHDVQVFTRAQVAANALATNAAFEPAVQPPRALPGPRSVQVGTFTDISNAKRVASRLSGMGEAVVSDDTLNGRAVHVVRVRVVNESVDPQAVIAAASDLGLDGAFVVRSSD